MFVYTCLGINLHTWHDLTCSGMAWLACYYYCCYYYYYCCYYYYYHYYSTAAAIYCYCYLLVAIVLLFNLACFELLGMAWIAWHGLNWLAWLFCLRATCNGCDMQWTDVSHMSHHAGLEAVVQSCCPSSRGRLAPYMECGLSEQFDCAGRMPKRRLAIKDVFTYHYTTTTTTA